MELFNYSRPFVFYNDEDMYGSEFLSPNRDQTDNKMDATEKGLEVKENSEQFDITQVLLDVFSGNPEPLKKFKKQLSDFMVAQGNGWIDAEIVTAIQNLDNSMFSNYEYNAFLALWKKYGSPQITLFCGKLYRPKNPHNYGNNIMLPMYIGKEIHYRRSIDDYFDLLLTELPHSVQYQNSGKAKMLGQKIRDYVQHSDNEYEEHGTLENEAHDIIEPKLRVDVLLDVLGLLYADYKDKTITQNHVVHVLGNTLDNVFHGGFSFDGVDQHKDEIRKALLPFGLEKWDVQFTFDHIEQYGSLAEICPSIYNHIRQKYFDQCPDQARDEMLMADLVLSTILKKSIRSVDDLCDLLQVILFVPDLEGSAGFNRHLGAPLVYKNTKKLLNNTSCIVDKICSVPNETNPVSDAMIDLRIKMALALQEKPNKYQNLLNQINDHFSSK